MSDYFLYEGPPPPAPEQPDDLFSGWLANFLAQSREPRISGTEPGYEVGGVEDAGWSSGTIVVTAHRDNWMELFHNREADELWDQLRGLLAQSGWAVVENGDTAIIGEIGWQDRLIDLIVSYLAGVGANETSDILGSQGDIDTRDATTNFDRRIVEERSYWDGAGHVHTGYADRRDGSFWIDKDFDGIFETHTWLIDNEVWLDTNMDNYPDLKIRVNDDGSG